MKHVLTIWLLQCILNVSSAQKSDEILGEWMSESQDAKILLFKQKGRLFGTIAWTQDEKAKDQNNPDPKLRDRSIVGLLILSDFVQEDDNTWSGGTIYDPAGGNTYKCNMELEGTKLKIRGYLGISLFGRTSTWTRYHEHKKP